MGPNVPPGIGMERDCSKRQKYKRDIETGGERMNTPLVLRTNIVPSRDSNREKRNPPLRTVAEEYAMTIIRMEVTS